MRTYCERIWLNSVTSASTGSAVAWHGETTYGNKKSEIATFFEVADCHCKVRLHKISIENMDEFINKIKLLAETASKFAGFLESEYKS